MSWALEGGEIERLDKDEELDFLEIRLQKLESKDFLVRRKSAQALAPFVAENRFLDEVIARFAVQPPHPAQVLADDLLGPNSEKNSCMSCIQSLAHMGPPAAPYASKALAVIMSNADEEMRWEAARALGHLGTGAAKEASAAMAKQLDPDKESSVLVRFTTARSLGLLGAGAAEGCSSALAKALRDKDKDVQNAAAVAFAQIGPNAAKHGAQALVQSMLEGTFELRRLALKALISMGEAAAGKAAYPTARVLLCMVPCCRGKHHPMKVFRKNPSAKDPATCDVCQAVGPAAQGTDYHCAGGCKWDVCRECYCKLIHGDVVLQRLAADAFYAMGATAVKTCQVYLARALGDKDELVKDAARKALEMAGCDLAMQGSMALYTKTSCPCDQVTCALCSNQKSQAMLGDEEAPAMLEDAADEDDSENESQSDGALSDLGDDDDEPPSDPAPEAAGPDAHPSSPAPAREDKSQRPRKFNGQVEAEAPREARPELSQPASSPWASQDAEEAEPTTESHPDPWGPAEQVSRSQSKRMRPSLEVDIGVARNFGTFRGKQTQPMVPLPPPSSVPPEDEKGD